MAEEQAPLPAALLAEIREKATEGFNFWKENSTEAQRVVGLEDMAKYQNDPAFVEQEMTMMQAAFDAQSPVDSRLDKTKYVAWVRVLQAASLARGNFEDTRESEMEKSYDTLNKVTPAADGVSMDDFNACMGTWMGILAELKVAAGM